jgi:hypothetical protein
VRAHAEGEDHPFSVFAGTEWVEVEEPDSSERPLVLDASPVLTDQLPLYAAYMAEGAIEEPDDEDWVEVHIREGDRISVRCFGPAFGSTLDPRIDLFGGGQLLTPDGQGSEDLENGYYVADVVVEGTGPFQVRVSDEGGETGPSAFWRCRILAAEFAWL